MPQSHCGLKPVYQLGSSKANFLQLLFYTYFLCPQQAAQTAAMAPARTADSGKKSAPPKKIVEAIREATGASDDDISAMLAECNYDVNEATSRLIDSK